MSFQEHTHIITMPWLCLRRERHSPVVEGRNSNDTTEIRPALLTIFGLYLSKFLPKKSSFAIILKEDSTYILSQNNYVLYKDTCTQ